MHKCTNFSGVDPATGKKCAGYEPRQARYGRGWKSLTEGPDGECEALPPFLLKNRHRGRCWVGLT